MIQILKYGDDLSKILNRSQLGMEKERQVVKGIISDVQLRGDVALFEYTKKFDGVALSSESILVTKGEVDAAYNQVSKELIDALRRAKDNIYEFHLRQVRKDDVRTTNGKTTGYLVRPVSRAGIYVPGGKAAYPSSVLMCAVPAIVAGVKEIIMTTPCGKWLNPLTLVAANECGIKKIYKVGGAQAIAAMAYGTESVPKVDVIAGPGNIYVALAKREVFGAVSIDMIAGPSEILIVADDSARKEFVAADMLSQAEHDELALSLVIATSEKIAIEIKNEAEMQLNNLPKKDIAQKSLDNYGAIVVVENLEQAITLVNQVAPEHLELCVKNPEKVLEKVENAGAVFLGNYSPEPLGDYYAGTNHVLPTSGTSRFFSALGVDNYVKKISVINYTQEALSQCAKDIVEIAETEGLQAHANSIKIRGGKL